MSPTFCFSAKPSRVFEIEPQDVQKIRSKLGKSQTEFALMIGVSVGTLRNWEQGRRRPDGPAQALLRVAAKNPAAVRAIRDLVRENYGERQLNISPDSIYTGALGAALFARRMVA